MYSHASNFLTCIEFNEQKIQEDATVIRNYYLNQGYMDINVTIETEFVIESEGKKAIIKFNVDTGKRYEFDKIVIDASEGLNYLTETEILDFFKNIKDGKYVHYENLINSLNNILQKYLEKGYSNALVSFKFEKSGDKLQIKVAIYEGGNPCYIQKVVIEGNARTLSSDIERELNLKVGDIFNLEKLSNSLAIIWSMGLFKCVTIVTKKGSYDDQVIILITLKESELFFIKYKLAYNIDTGLGIGGSLNLRKLFNSDWEGTFNGFYGFTNKSVFFDLNNYWLHTSFPSYLESRIGLDWTDTPFTLNPSDYNVIPSNLNASYFYETFKFIAEMKIGYDFESKNSNIGFIDQTKIFTSYIFSVNTSNPARVRNISNEIPFNDSTSLHLTSPLSSALDGESKVTSMIRLGFSINKMKFETLNYLSGWNFLQQFDYAALGGFSNFIRSTSVFAWKSNPFAWLHLHLRVGLDFYSNPIIGSLQVLYEDRLRFHSNSEMLGWATFKSSPLEGLTKFSIKLETSFKLPYLEPFYMVQIFGTMGNISSKPADFAGIFKFFASPESDCQSYSPRSIECDGFKYSMGLALVLGNPVASLLKVFIVWTFQMGLNNFLEYLSPQIGLIINLNSGDFRLW